MNEHGKKMQARALEIASEFVGDAKRPRNSPEVILALNFISLVNELARREAADAAPPTG